MRHLRSIILIVILVGTLWSCGSGNKSKQIKDYKYTEEKSTLNDSIAKKAGSWIREGLTCYGIIISVKRMGHVTMVKIIEAKVVSIQPDLIKLKSMEDLVMAPIQGCDRVSIKKGDTWEEKEGELFRTRAEAVKYVQTNYPNFRFGTE